MIAKIVVGAMITPTSPPRVNSNKQTRATEVTTERRETAEVETIPGLTRRTNQTADGTGTAMITTIDTIGLIATKD